MSCRLLQPCDQDQLYQFFCSEICSVWLKDLCFCPETELFHPTDLSTVMLNGGNEKHLRGKRCIPTYLPTELSVMWSCCHLWIGWTLTYSRKSSWATCFCFVGVSLNVKFYLDRVQTLKHQRSITGYGHRHTWLKTLSSVTRATRGHMINPIM